MPVENVIGMSRRVERAEPVALAAYLGWVTITMMPTAAVAFVALW
jgi:hypothetical protein